MNPLTTKLVDRLTAKLVVVNLVKLHFTKFIDYSTYFKEVIQYVLLSIQSGVHSIEVFNNRNQPNTIYFSVRACLIEVSVE